MQNWLNRLETAVENAPRLVVWRTMPRWVGLIAFVTAAAIAVSTLLTKQHYVLDILVVGSLPPSPIGSRVGRGSNDNQERRQQAPGRKPGANYFNGVFFDIMNT